MTWRAFFSLCAVAVAAGAIAAAIVWLGSPSPMDRCGIDCSGAPR